MEPRKQAICDALRTWINQRPGFDPNNYDRAGYLSDSRRVQQQARDARELLRAVELSSITADALIAAFPHAFSGRLTVEETSRFDVYEWLYSFKFDYCTGQYWCMEYRAAACAALASALWVYTREECMPQPCNETQHGKLYSWSASKVAIPGGEWLRAHFKQQFGRGIASRWFN